MELYKNESPVYSYEPSYSGKNVYVSIDSSKSNTAMFVWDEYGFPLDDYEISGAGSQVNVYDLCWQTRIELEKLFRGAHILRVGIEDIITKKEGGYKGIEIHQSRHKITAVFDNLVFFFQMFHNQTPRFINNQAWKAGVLPEEYRKRTHDKGSKDWLMDMGSRWGHRKDDVTDAYCIGLFLLRTENVESVYSIEHTEPAEHDFEYGIFPVEFPIPQGAKNFVIKNDDSLSHNIQTVSNRIAVGQAGCILVPAGLLSMEDVYSDEVKTNSSYKFQRGCENVLAIVFRK